MSDEEQPTILEQLRAYVEGNESLRTAHRYGLRFESAEDERFAQDAYLREAVSGFFQDEADTRRPVTRTELRLFSEAFHFCSPFQGFPLSLSDALEARLRVRAHLKDWESYLEQENVLERWETLPPEERDDWERTYFQQHWAPEQAEHWSKTLDEWKGPIHNLSLDEITQLALVCRDIEKVLRGIMRASDFEAHYAPPVALVRTRVELERVGEDAYNRGQAVWERMRELTKRLSPLATGEPLTVVRSRVQEERLKEIEDRVRELNRERVGILGCAESQERKLRAQRLVDALKFRAMEAEGFRRENPACEILAALDERLLRDSAENEETELRSQLDALDGLGLDAEDLLNLESLSMAVRALERSDLMEIAYDLIWKAGGLPRVVHLDPTTNNVELLAAKLRCVIAGCSPKRVRRFSDRLGGAGNVQSTSFVLELLRIYEPGAASKSDAALKQSLKRAPVISD